MNNGDHLTDRQREYVQHLARGLDSRVAARSAGYSESFSKVASHRLGKKTAVAQAIESIRAEGMKIAVYDLATAMREAEAVCAFAKLHKNAMAYCKGTELRAKLSGLLIDRVEVVEVDLRGALARAEARVVNATQLSGPLCDASPPVALPNGSVPWRPKIPGDSEYPEAGPADGQ
jgi:phage terminase small subunit